MNDRRRKLLMTVAQIGLLVGAVAIAYWPARHGGYVLDDEQLVVDSPLIKSPTGWYRFWTPEALDFWPITNDVFWVQWRIWGMNPTGYHVVNIALQVADSLLIWLILLRLQIPGAYLAAMLFAVHPVNVESVAWISQLKNQLALLFFLLSIQWYLLSNRAFDSRYAFSIAAFLLAGLSKGSVLILPLILVLLDWWRGRLRRAGDVIRITPFIAIAAVLALIDIWFQTHLSGTAVRNVTFDQRFAGAGAVVWFYLAKALVPIGLVFVYPQWNIQTDQWRWWLPLVGVLAISAALIWLRNNPRVPWVRPLLFAWLFFCIALLPVMGITDVGFMKFSLVADHYQQIALIAVVASIAASGAKLMQYLEEHAPRFQWLGSIATTAVVVTLMYLSFDQSQLYAGPVELYSATSKANPDCWMIENNLGLALADEGKLNEALPHYQQAAKLNPQGAEAYCNWAVALAKLGQPDAARQQFRQALAINPHDSQAHEKLGQLLAADGQTQSALKEYEIAIQLRSDDADLHYNYGLLLASDRQLAAAIEQFRESLRLDATNLDTRQHLGIALAMSGQLTEALKAFQQVEQARGDNIEAHFNLAMAYERLNRHAEAVAAANRALQLARTQNQLQLQEQIKSWLNSLPGTTPSSANERPAP